MRVAWVPALLKCEAPTGLLQSMAQGSTYVIWTRDKGRLPVECRSDFGLCPETLNLTLSNEAGWRPSAPATSPPATSLLHYPHGPFV